MVEGEPHHFDYPNWFTCKHVIRAIWTSIVESHNYFENLRICLTHWFAYQCLCLTLISLFMTFILVIVHVSSIIHLVCCIIYSSAITTRIFYKPSFCCEQHVIAGKDPTCMPNLVLSEDIHFLKFNEEIYHIPKTFPCQKVNFPWNLGWTRAIWQGQQ